jgi:hypothetical protein
MLHQLSLVITLIVTGRSFTPFQPAVELFSEENKMEALS